MFSFQTKVALTLLKPVVLNIIGDIIKSGTISRELGKIRANVIDHIMVLVGKTHFSWDDELAEIVLSHMLSDGTVDSVTSVLLDSVEMWVNNTETTWDNDLLLPAIQQFRDVIVANGGEDE